MKNQTENIKSILFSTIQIHQELMAQGLISRKGEAGAFLLYQMCKNLYMEKKCVTQRILFECGFNPAKNKEITIGEFILKQDMFSAIHLTQPRYLITLNNTIATVFNRNKKLGNTK